LITIAINCIGQSIESILCQRLRFASNKLDVDAAKIELGKAYFLQPESMIKKLRAINLACGGKHFSADQAFPPLSRSHTRGLSLFRMWVYLSLFFPAPTCVCVLFAAL
jgi:hypothetical protein